MYNNIINCWELSFLLQFEIVENCHFLYKFEVVFLLCFSLLFISGTHFQIFVWFECFYACLLPYAFYPNAFVSHHPCSSDSRAHIMIDLSAQNTINIHILINIYIRILYLHMCICVYVCFALCRFSYLRSHKTCMYECIKQIAMWYMYIHTDLQTYNI